MTLDEPTAAAAGPTNAFRVDGTVAIVTGASKGIGRASALALAGAGAAGVVVVARGADTLNATAEELRALGSEAHVMTVDMMDTDAIAGIVPATLERFGRLDIVVNNAGGSPPKPITQTSINMMQMAFRFNVVSAFALSQAAIDPLLDTHGCIINISSAIGRLTGRGIVAYGTAKGALSHMTRLMAAELAPRIRVNAIAVGATLTDALATVMDDAIEREIARRTPMRRIGQPSDIANGVLYLASPAAGYVTGKVLEIDGGIEAPNLPSDLADL